jgi:hypothetical protein
MTAYVAKAHMHVQRLVSVVKMATVLEEYNIERQRSAMCFFVGKRTQCKGRSKIADDARQGAEAAKTTVKDFYAAGFDALVKRWDKCINVGGGYVEKYMFLQCSNKIYFTFYIHL